MFRLTRHRKSFAAALALTAFTLGSCGTSTAVEPAAQPEPAAAGSSAPVSSIGTSAAGSSSAGASTGAEGAAPSINLGPDQNRITTPEVAAIAALVPASIREKGTIVITGFAGSTPPLRFYADDDTTVIGSEVDLAYLFADVLGLEVELKSADWAQNFVAIDAGNADAFIGNVTVTQERKEKYDFATYRNDNLAVEVKAGSGLKVTGAKDLAGKSVGVGSGTNQEKILVDWSAENTAAGLEPIAIKYYQNASDYYLAIASGRLDAYFGPNPSAAFHVASTGETEIAGTFSGAGAGLQGEIAVLTKEGNGLAAAFAAAINETIKNGSYGEVLARWNLTNESVAKSEINPPGLPKTES